MEEAIKSLGDVEFITEYTDPAAMNYMIHSLLRKNKNLREQLQEQTILANSTGTEDYLLSQITYLKQRVLGLQMEIEQLKLIIEQINHICEEEAKDSITLQKVGNLIKIFGDSQNE